MLLDDLGNEHYRREDPESFAIRIAAEGKRLMDEHRARWNIVLKEEIDR
jgi:hypothetical protein